MPEPTPIYKGVLDINSTSARQGRSEGYYLAGGSWDDAAAQLQVIAKLRASLLGRDAEVSYAVVSQAGGNRRSQCVLTSPITGGLGVLWDDEVYTESALNSQSPTNTLRFRQGTDDRDYVMRQLCCIPDGLINASKYQGETVPNTVDLGVYDTPIALADVNLGTQTLWTYGTSITGVTTHHTWQTMLRWYLRVVHQYTLYAKPYEGLTYTNKAWKLLAFRGVGRAKLGRPILR